MDRETQTDRVDGETQRESNRWANSKGIEWIWKHKESGMDGQTQRDRVDGETQRESNGWGNKGNRMDGEIQRESNGWVNTKVIEWMGKHKGNRMDG